MGKKIKERLFYVAIISSILIIILIFNRPIKDSYKHDYKKFWLEKTFASDDYDIVVIGDSRVYRGVSTKEMEKLIENKKVLNFGYSAARLDNLLLTKGAEKLNTKKEPIIILGITPNSLTEIANANADLLENLQMPREEKYEILYFYDVLKYFDVFNLEKINKSQEAPLEPKNYLEEFHSGGWIASDYLREDTNAALPSYRSWFQDNKVSQKMVNRLLKQVNKWTLQGIKVYGFCPPTSFSMVQLEDSLSGFDSNRFVHEFVKRGGKWLVFDNTNFHSYDGSHLEKQSAILLSKQLALKIGDGK